MTKTILAIDPGTSKCGFALVRRELDGSLTLVEHEVAPLDDLVARVQQFQANHPFAMVIVGSSTNSKEVVGRLREHLPAIGVMVVDERNTSEEARARYWEHNPRRGWRRLLPSTLQLPPVPIDDFAALVLAERVLLE
ncbi:MAG: Holliday junction resolvase RuvX [Chthonomonas sp.]|nr:Holliday junction resolvase RuvX [Chthonomonas sp.]